MRGLNRRLACALLMTAALLAPTVAEASSTGDRLCLEEAGSSATLPTDTAVRQAATGLEDVLSRAAQTAAPLKSLSPLEQAEVRLQAGSSAAESPGAEAVARFCYAAGELIRVAPEGSLRQAQSYLLTALRRSFEAKLPELAARTAYKMGLVTPSGTSLRTLRGKSTSTPDADHIAARLRDLEAVEGQRTCPALTQVASADLGGAEAMLSLECAARLAAAAGDPLTGALATLRFARNALQYSDSSDEPAKWLALAQEHSLAGLELAGRVSNPQLRGELLGRLSNVALQAGTASSAPVSAAIAQIRSSSAGNAAEEATVAELEARLALRRGDGAAARRFIEIAILSESQRSLPLRVPTFFLLLAQAEPSRREEHVAAAYAALENIRPRIPRYDPLTEEPMFALYMRQVFESAADVQLTVAGSAGNQIGGVQQIVEAYRQAELQSAVGSECLPERAQVRPEDLASGEVLLYPLVFADRVELIVLAGTASGERRFERLEPNRSASRHDVAKAAEKLIRALNSGRGADYRAPARALYDILIRPIEAKLGPNSSLAIIPDRTLRGVPFGALLGSDGRFLVQRTALSVAPALAYSQPGTTLRNDQVSIVAAALAREVSLPAGYFPALAGTTSEAQIAAQNGRPGRLFSDFTRDQLVTSLKAGRVDVLHLATHASFNGRSDRSFIVASDGIVRLAELRDMVEQNRVRDDFLDLLVLSACETAVGDDQSSMGLAGAAVQAGALSAIASLWPVDDAGTAELMRHFYKAYRSGRSRAQALREAQIAMIDSGAEKADPFVWAAFTLVGAWR